jgi:chemotaxis protein histidine kinase CheA
MESTSFNATSFNATSFNASVTVTELLMKTLENVSKELASRCIREVSVRHNLNAEEEIRILGLENLSLIRKEMKRKSVTASGSGSVKKEKVKKEKKVVEKPSVIMPFVSECVDKDGCEGLNFNRSLFTQCPKKKMENGSFCSKCQSEADKNTSGIPDCGTVTMRLSQGLYEFKDPSGRSPVSYLKVLDKLKINMESALEEAGKFNIKIPEEHLTVMEKVEKKSSISRGRPKKESVKIATEDVSDLFAKLTVDDSTFDEEEVVVSEEPKPKKSKLSEEEKAAKKAALDAEREAKKQEREAKLAEEKEKKRLEKEAKLSENKAQTKAEREAKLAEEKAQAKAEKEAKIAQEKEQKRLEKEAKIAQEKAEREAKIAQEKAEREAKREAEKAAKAEAKKPKAAKAAKAVAEPVVKATKAAKVVAEPEAKAEAAPPAKVSVTRKEINGKQYLKSSSNILYDPLTKEEVGLCDPETETIKELPEEDDDEVEEEEYESDDN